MSAHATRAAADPQPACPWSTLDEAGTGLDLEDFLSFHVVRLAGALQRTTFRAYLDPHGLSAPDWRVLGLVRRYGPIRFADVVERTGLDKAQVSRTVRHLDSKGWLATEPDASHAQRLMLSLTPSGRRLHDRILPQAARAQAGLLRALPVAQREQLWAALLRLQVLVAEDASAVPGARTVTAHSAACSAAPVSSPTSAPTSARPSRRRPAR